MPTSSWKADLKGLLERETRALRDADAASAPGEIRGYRGPPPAEFSMATPRAARAKTTPELGHESPTRGQLVPGCTITSELYVILEAHDIDEDEASNDAAERLNAMGHELEVAGYPKNMTDAAIQLEWYVRDLVSKWRNEAARSGSPEGPGCVFFDRWKKFVIFW